MGFAITHGYYAARNGKETHEVSIVHVGEQGEIKYFDVSGFGESYEAALDNFRKNYHKVYEPYMKMMIEMDRMNTTLMSGNRIVPMEVEDWINLPNAASELDKAPDAWILKNWGVKDE